MTPAHAAKVLSHVNQLQVWLLNVAALVKNGEDEAAFTYAERVSDLAPEVMELIGEDIKIWTRASLSPSGS